MRTNKELLNMLRSLKNIQLNSRYRKLYILELKKDILLSRSRNKAGIRGYSKGYVHRLENLLKDIDKNYPFIKKIKVEIEL